MRPKVGLMSRLYHNLITYFRTTSDAAEVGLIPHGHHPPRKITVWLRKTKSGRNFENLEDVIRIIEATGEEERGSRA